MPEITNPFAALILWAFVGYVLGSIPFGILIARAMNLGNLREIGSGNIGATNVLRTGNKTAAALTLAFDAGKGAIAVLLARWLAGEDAAQIAAFAAFVGHCYPIWLGFRGGKGVATYFGLLLALAWPVGIGAGAVWLIVAATTRYSSLAALVAAVLAPVISPLFGYFALIGLAVILALLIGLRHNANIARLYNGTETKIGVRD